MVCSICLFSCLWCLTEGGHAICNGQMILVHAAHMKARRALRLPKSSLGRTEEVSHPTSSRSQILVIGLQSSTLANHKLLFWWTMDYSSDCRTASTIGLSLYTVILINKVQIHTTNPHFFKIIFCSYYLKVVILHQFFDPCYNDKSVVFLNTCMHAHTHIHKHTHKRNKPENVKFRVRRLHFVFLSNMIGK